MANGILKNLNRSLEITLRDNLDGLKEFTLMMASASVRPQYEVVTVEHTTPVKPECSSPSLTLLDTTIDDEYSALFRQQSRQQKKRA